MPFQICQTEYERKVCNTVMLYNIKSIITGLHKDRAPGMDGVMSSMIKFSFELCQSKMTDFINCILSDAVVPESLLVGNMTIIDKKESSHLVGKKRPLCVTSVVLSVITKVIHKQMDKVCEREELYSKVQYSFRKGRSMKECVFMLLAASRKAKIRNQLISIAFSDITKAYDSVNHELLNVKLDLVCFGGKVKTLIQSMYYNDSVQVRIGNRLSRLL